MICNWAFLQYSRITCSPLLHALPPPTGLSLVTQNHTTVHFLHLLGYENLIEWKTQRMAATAKGTQIGYGFSITLILRDRRQTQQNLKNCGSGAAVDLSSVCEILPFDA